MPALHPPSAMPAPAHVNAKLDPFHLGLRYLGLILLLDLGLFQFAAAVRATIRQFALQRWSIVEGIGRRLRQPYLAPAFRPGLAGWAFGL